MNGERGRERDGEREGGGDKRERERSYMHATHVQFAQI